MATDVMLFQFIGETVTNATNSFVAPAAGNLIAALKTTAILGVTLHFVLQGYAIISGAVQEPFFNLLKQAAKIIIIAAFALNADNYANYVVEGFNGLESGLSEALSASGEPASIYATLDASIAKGFDVVGVCMENADRAGWHIGTAAGWIIAALVVAIGTLLVTIAGGAMVIVAKFSLALLFAVGPLFIMCLMWPATAKFFDSWFGQVLNYIMTVVFITVVMAFAMVAYDGVVAAAKFDGGGDENPMFAALQIGGITGVLMFIIYQVGGLASGVAGGISMAAMTLRDVARPITAPAKAVSDQLRHNRSEADRKRQLAHYDKSAGGGGGSVSKANSGAGAAYKAGLQNLMQRQNRPGISGGR